MISFTIFHIILILIFIIHILLLWFYDYFIKNITFIIIGISISSFWLREKFLLCVLLTSANHFFKLLINIKHITRSSHIIIIILRFEKTSFFPFVFVELLFDYWVSLGFAHSFGRCSGPKNFIVICFCS